MPLRWRNFSHSMWSKTSGLMLARGVSPYEATKSTAVLIQTEDVVMARKWREYRGKRSGTWFPLGWGYMFDAGGLRGEEDYGK